MMVRSSFGLEYGVHPIDGRFEILVLRSKSRNEDVLYAVNIHDSTWDKQEFTSVADAMAWIEAMKLVGL